MDTPRVDEQITEQLFQRLDESKWLHISLMNRIEGRIRTKAQLERYIQALVHKLEATEFRSEWLIDRIDRLIELHQRIERYEDIDGAGRWDAADAYVGSR